MPDRLTAGTIRARHIATVEPHRFIPRDEADWGYRPPCSVCGEDKVHELHREQ